VTTRALEDTTTVEQPPDLGAGDLEGEPTEPPTRAALLVVRDSALVLVATLLPLVLLLRLWEGGLRIPFTYDGDALSVGALVQTTIDKGWIYETSRLGAPFAADARDYALGGDNLNWLVFRILAFGSQDWALVTNLFFIATFPAAALSAFFALRWLGASRWTALPAAVLFAFMPYHFARGTAHLLLASYWVVPLGIVLAVRVSRGDHPFHALRSRDRRRLVLAGFWLLICVLVGSLGTYYAVFTLLLVGSAALLGAATRRTWKPVLAGAVTGLTIAVVHGVNLLPTFLYVRAHGDNPLVTRREVFEVDTYGLRIAQLFTPVPGHRFGPLRSLSRDLLDAPSNSEPGMFLGLVASVALLAMIVSLFVRALRPPEPADAHGRDDDVRPLLAVLTLIGVLVATTGGLSWFLGLAGLRDIRGWNRMSIFIAFLVLAWLALTLDRIVTRLPARRLRVLALAVPVIVALAIADQTSHRIVPDRRDNAATYRIDRAYFADIERRLPAGAMVFQLPYVRYPESPNVVDSGDYDLMRPYLHTSKLRWSYGGIKGRESEWQQRTVVKPVPEMIADLVAAGFSGLLVDRAGYADRAAALANEITAATTSPAEPSENGRWFFFDLAPAIARYERERTPEQRANDRRAVLETPIVNTTDCYEHEVDDAGVPFRWCPDDGELLIDNYGAERPARVHLAFSSANRKPATIALRVGETERRVATDAEGHAELTLPLDLREGRTTISYESDVSSYSPPGDSRDLYLRVDDPQIAL
jgi:phosphoglycerol transferase